YNVTNVTQINGDQDAPGESDAIRIARTGTFLDVTRNGVNVLHVDYATAPAIALAGLAGDDTITVDFSGGNPIPAAGLSVDAGDGTGDVVSIIGSGAGDAVTLAAG